MASLVSEPSCCWFPKANPLLGLENTTPPSKPEPGLIPHPPDGVLQPALSLCPHTSDFIFCFLVAVLTGPQNKPVRKTSAADNGELGMVRPPREAGTSGGLVGVGCPGAVGQHYRRELDSCFSLPEGLKQRAEPGSCPCDSVGT